MSDLVKNTSSVVLIALVIACVVMAVLVGRPLAPSMEPFVTASNSTGSNIIAPTSSGSASTLASYGIMSLAEARAIVDGTWNENWESVPRSDATILYYSIFSALSRLALYKSPFTWANISPVFLAKLPENCKVDDSKVVFMNQPFADNTVLGMYTKGIQLNNNKANGPLAMNMGINMKALGVAPNSPQRFSVAMLLRFNGLTSFAGQTLPSRMELLNMKANTSNNNGLKLSVEVSNTTVPDFYSVALRIAFGDSQDQLTPSVTIKTYQNVFYVVNIVRNGGVVSFAMHEIDILQTEIKKLSAMELNYGDVIDFSNMPMQLAGGGGLHISNILAMTVYQSAYSDSELMELALYWRKMLNKTSPVAYALCQQALALSACPFPSSNVCNTCTTITDWRNVNQLLTAPSACRVAYNAFCTSNTSFPGCECYGEASLSNQACLTWRNMIKGTSSCTQTDIDNYLKQNGMLGNNVPLPTTQHSSSMLVSRFERLRDFVKSEEYDTSDMYTPKKQVGFWEWLFGINI